MLSVFFVAYVSRFVRDLCLVRVLAQMQLLLLSL
jgi:hypothetical protein